MEKLIIPVILGVALIIMGIVNMTGNISTLRRHHRKRVAPEDVKPFGRLVGIGTVIIGICIALMGVFDHVAQTTNNPSLSSVGMIVLPVGLLFGTGIMIFAMIKYNKGIF